MLLIRLNEDPMLFLEYHNVDKMMDALNSALDNLESQSDALYQEAKNILELSKREQLQEKTNESESYNQTDCNTNSSNTDSSNTDNSNTGSSVVPGEHSNDASISNSLFVSTGGNASTSNTSSSTSEACSNRLSVQEADSEEPSKLESAD